MSAAWDGYPQNREQSGWHWLADERGPEPDYWIADLQGWRYAGLPERAKVRAAGYLGPCHRPNEVAAIKTERDRLKDALHRISLGSQNSATTKEKLGSEARAALKETDHD